MALGADLLVAETALRLADAFPGRITLGVAFLRSLGFGFRGVSERLGGFAFLDDLLGFEDVAAAFIEIDAAGARGAVRVMERDAALEDVGGVGCGIRAVRCGCACVTGKGRKFAFTLHERDHTRFPFATHSISR